MTVLGGGDVALRSSSLLLRATTLAVCHRYCGIKPTEAGCAVLLGHFALSVGAVCSVSVVYADSKRGGMGNG